jgi:hypothetical protein
MYKINQNGQVERTSDSFVISESYGVDYDDFVTWVNQGNEPIPYVEQSKAMKTYEFRDRFDSLELIKLIELGKTDNNAALLLLLVQTTEFVDLNSGTLIAGVNYLAYKGVIDTSRITQILS